MGDGDLHPTFLTNEKDPDEMHRVELAMKEIFDRALALGGTITSEIRMFSFFMVSVGGLDI